MRRSFQRLHRVAALAAVVCGVVVAAPTAANASGPATVVSPARTITSRAVLNVNGRAVESVIVCEIQAQYPHDSSHVPGTVNAVSTISCTSPVSSLDIWTDLYYAGTYLYATGYNYNYGSAFVQTNAAGTCIPGAYENVADGFVVFPPGYVPSSGWIGATSGLQTVDCA